MTPIDGEETLPIWSQIGLERKRIMRAQTSLLDYMRFTLPRFQFNWHFEKLCSALDRVAAGELLRLMVFMPPRHGKSESCSVRFPAQYLGKNPQNQVILASYADSLARTFSRATRETIASPQHQRCFPSSFSVEGDVQWQLSGKENGRPSFIAAGVGGGISGQGANLLVIDDPVKNAEEADSPVMRDKAESWYYSTAESRLQPGGAVVIVMTRWHEDDLAGRLLRKAKEDPKADQWEVIEFPATNMTGEVASVPAYEALWANNYSAEHWKKKKATTPARVWHSLYQQKPAPQEGVIIQRDWIKFYLREGDEIPAGCKGIRIAPKKFHQQIQSWDMAFKDLKTSDFVSGTIWGRNRADMYLLDRINDRLDINGSLRAVRMMSQKWPETDWKYVEDKANGTAVIGLLKSEISGLIPVEPDGGKVPRMVAASPAFSSGNVYLPHPSIAPWVHDVVEQLCSFPFGLHDDDADSISQAINKMKRHAGGMLGFAEEQTDEELGRRADEAARNLGVNPRDLVPEEAGGMRGMVTG